MASELQELLSAIDEARKAWTACQSSLAEVGFNMENPHPSFNMSTQEFDRGLIAALELAASIEPEKRKALEPMLRILPGYRPMLDGLFKIRDMSNTIRGFVQAASEAQKSVSVVDNNVLRDTGGKQLNLSSHFQEIRNGANNFLGQLIVFHGLLLGGNVTDLASRAQQFHELTENTRQFVAKIKQYEKEGDTRLKAIKNAEQKAQQQLATTELTNQKATGVNATAAQALTEVNAKLANIRETAKTAETLRAKVDTYNSQYEAFDSALSKRLKLFEEFEGANKTAQQQNQAREQEIDKITQEANHMLQGATNAGLAKAFNDASERYDKEALKAKNGFYWSIVFLMASVLPLASYVFSIPYLDTVAAPPSTGVTLGGVLSRIVILLPGVWLTSFTALRYSSLFQLHREYAFKAAIAMSVDGFKRQSPQFEQEIAGAAFVGLAEKPEYAPHKESAKAPNPILGYLLIYA